MKKLPLSPETQAKADKLFAAIRAKNEQACLRMLESYSDNECKQILAFQDSNKQTPLHQACWHQLELVAKLMIDKGASLTLCDDYDRTPLHLACLIGLESVALAMVEKNPPLNDMDTSNHIPLDNAFSSGLTSVACRIIEKMNSQSESLKSFEKMANAEFIRSMLDPILYHVLLPQLLTAPDGKIVDIEFNEQLIKDWINGMRPALFSALCPTPVVQRNKENGTLTKYTIDSIFRPERLSRTWHHPPIVFPRRDKVPLEGRREWYPLFKEPINMGNGLWLHCLSSSKALAEEGRLLHHCVGNGRYDASCLIPNGELSTHILSIREGRGVDASRYSTLEIELKASDPKSILELSHRAVKNKNPSQKELAAWNKFLKQCVDSKKPSPFEKGPWGETPKSQEEMNQYSLLEQNCGYPAPTYEKINDCFDEYRRGTRRESLGVAPNRHLVYVSRTEDGYHNTHLIQGFALVDTKGNPKSAVVMHASNLPAAGKDERVVDLRDLDAAHWMRATGLMEKGRSLLKKLLWTEEDKKLPWFKENLNKVETIWEAQDEALNKNPFPSPRPLPKKPEPPQPMVIHAKRCGSLAGPNANARDPFAPFS